LPEVVGTVAGDDTVLLITRHARAGREVARLFEGWARG
jgi:arginine repressor